MAEDEGASAAITAGTLHAPVSSQRSALRARHNKPHCNHCLASSLDGHKSAFRAHHVSPPIPQLESKDKMNLHWPPMVEYSCSETTSQDEGSESVLGQQARFTGIGPLNFQDFLDSNEDFRLARLLPGTDKQPIHVQIESLNLADVQEWKYDALSYMWAESLNFQRYSPVYVGPYWDITYVTRNCAEALQRLRLKEQDRLLWVDCLCIDQDQPLDRIHQVGLMREIYMNAASVIAYLDTPSAGTDHVFEVFRLVLTGEISVQHAWAEEDIKCALKAFYRRRFFSRTWIYLELILARSVQFVCGESSALWPQPFWNNHALLDERYRSLYGFDQAFFSGLAKDGILQALVHFSEYECSDPRDKVFGILSALPTPVCHSDYRLPVEVVYTGIAAYIVQVSRDLSALCQAGIGKTNLEIPSWVPDWSRPLLVEYPEESLWLKNSLDGHVKAVLGITGCLIRRLNFLCVISQPPHISIDAGTGSLRIRALKVCDVYGTLTRTKDHCHILVPLYPHQGLLLISLTDKNYAGSVTDNGSKSADSVFILDEWDDHPVILRSQNGKQTYSLVSVCTLAYIHPGSEFRGLLPWDSNRLVASGGLPDPITVTTAIIAPLTPAQMQPFSRRFDTALLELSAMPDPPPLERVTDSPISARLRLTEYSLLKLVRLPSYERKIREKFISLDERLGEMFLDEAAVWTVLKSLEQRPIKSRSGVAEMTLSEETYKQFQGFCGPFLPSSYQWDAARFCRSYLRRPNANPAIELKNIKGPVSRKLLESCGEIHELAKVTEQILRFFRWTEDFLTTKYWPCFPGHGLFEEWLYYTQCPCVLREINGCQWPPLCGTTCRHSNSWPVLPLKKNPAEGPPRPWSWPRFRETLKARDTLWRLLLPEPLDPVLNVNMATLVSMRGFGLKLDEEELITII